MKNTKCFALLYSGTKYLGTWCTSKRPPWNACPLNKYFAVVVDRIVLWVSVGVLEPVLSTGRNPEHPVSVLYWFECFTLEKYSEQAQKIRGGDQHIANIAGGWPMHQPNLLFSFPLLASSPAWWFCLFVCFFPASWGQGDADAPSTALTTLRRGHQPVRFFSLVL